MREKGVKYPRCVDGGRKCPPEDCSGVPGYYDFIDAILNPSHEEHDRLLECYGGKYDPEEFDPEKVKFDNPKKRWKIAFLR